MSLNNPGSNIAALLIAALEQAGEAKSPAELTSTIERVIESWPKRDPANYSLILVEEELSRHSFNVVSRRFNAPIQDPNILLFVLHGINNSDTAFKSAIAGQVDAVKQFLEEFPFFKDKSGSYGQTLLYVAARNGHLPIVKYLVEEMRCNVNVQNVREKSSPLHGASFYDRRSVVDYLLAKGANTNLINSHGETALKF